MISYNERIGSHGPDSVFATDGDIVYAGPGNDQLFLSPVSHAYLVGGPGNDTYLLGIASYAVILDSGGHDTIVAPFQIAPGSTFAVTIDGGRHLIVGDINSETLLMVADIRNHPVELFSFTDYGTSQHGMESAIRDNGMHMGDVSYSQFEQLGLGNAVFWSTGMQAELDHILGRESELFGSTSTGSPGDGLNPAPDPDPAPATPTHTPEPPAASAPYFDAGWYLSQYPDIAAGGIDPFMHYIEHGWREGRDPNQFFDTDWYLAQNPDIAAGGINPAEHYWNYGWKEHRDPSAAFDTSHYLETYPDIALAGINPLEHYLVWGLMEGREIAPG